MIIREMTADDIVGVVKIDNSSFSMKWDEKEFLNELEKDYAHYFTAVDKGEIIGFAGVWCVYETADIEKIAAAPEARRKGVGGALLEALIQRSRECGCTEMMLEVRDSNIAAWQLYKKYGFEEIAVRKGYYNGEDAVIMKLIPKGANGL